ncbi:hypothetical protein [Rheinheimera sp.]|uniref:hypothetical protein n=1 Tax=Rheinheimera sp. TaxID=1869214 RepID=UPI0040480A1F
MKYRKGKVTIRKPSVDAVQTKEIRKLKKQVSTLCKTDMKYVQTDISLSTLVNSTPYSAILNGITRGSDNLNRNGDYLRWERISGRMIIHALSALTATTFIRVALVQTKKNTGASFDFLKVYNDSTPEMLSMPERAFGEGDIKNHKILWERDVILSPRVTDYTSTTGLAANVPGSFYFFKFNKKINCMSNYALGNAGTVADIEEGALHFVAFSDTGTASAITVVVNVQVTGCDV